MSTKSRRSFSAHVPCAPVQFFRGEGKSIPWTAFHKCIKLRNYICCFQLYEFEIRVFLPSFLFQAGKKRKDYGSEAAVRNRRRVVFGNTALTYSIGISGCFKAPIVAAAYDDPAVCRTLPAVTPSGPGPTKASFRSPPGLHAQHSLSFYARSVILPQNPCPAPSAAHNPGTLSVRRLRPLRTPPCGPLH